jgi:hypothetical protein
MRGDSRENEEKGEKNCVGRLQVQDPIDSTDHIRVHVAAFLQLHRNMNTYVHIYIHGWMCTYTYSY